MRIEETGIPGCVIVIGDRRADARGWFLKTFHADMFAALGLRTDWREDYVSASQRDVVRGLHFQRPPHHHAKLATCVTGAVTDVLVDLRRGSPTYGQHRAVQLDGGSARSVYMPSGIAHGFVSRADDSLMAYKVTSVHDADSDAGIAWDSIGFDWTVAAPLLSDRDRGFPRLQDFDTPFTFDPAAAYR